jgi:hypothetical protein
MRSPAPRWRAGNRAEVIRNETSHSIARTEPEADFAAIYLARRFGPAIRLRTPSRRRRTWGGRSDERRS